MTCTLYWIYEEGMTDPYRQGYIGETKRDPQVRLKEHIRIDRFKGRDVKMDILFQGTQEEVWEKEKEYRPKEFIGWNKTAGGEIPKRPVGLPLSEAHRKSIGQTQLGKNRKPHSEETKAKMRAKALERERIRRESGDRSVAEKISKALTGRDLSEEHRKNISEGQRGEKNWNYGKKLSEETKRKISETKKGTKYNVGKTKKSS